MRFRSSKPARRGPRKVHLNLAGVLLLLAIAVGVSGCAGVEVAPKSVLIEPAGGGDGKAVLVSTGAGGVTGNGTANFEITAQAITGKEAAFFEFVGGTTCAGTKWLKVKKGEIKVCNVNVNAKKGNYTSGVVATLETTYKINAGAAQTIKTPLAQK